MKHHTSSLRTAVESHLAGLRTHEPEFLRSLPEQSEYPITIGGATRFITTWRQTFADGATLIVVQAKHELGLGIGLMIAEGFVVTSDGRLKTPTDDQISEYR